MVKKKDLNANILSNNANPPTPHQPKTFQSSPKTEPTSAVWQGEPGPELPKSYNKTILRAIPKNPHTAFVYWDVDQKSQQKINRPNNAIHTVLRVYGGSNLPQTEITVSLEADHCYVELQPNHTYAFELGTIDQENHYQTLVRSKLLTMPADTLHPSTQPLSNVNTNSPSSQQMLSSPTSWMDATSTFKPYD